VPKKVEGCFATFFVPAACCAIAAIALLLTVQELLKFAAKVVDINIHVF
jgi:hypothetical protein